MVEQQSLKDPESEFSDDDVSRKPRSRPYWIQKHDW